MLPLFHPLRSLTRLRGGRRRLARRVELCDGAPVWQGKKSGSIGVPWAPIVVGMALAFELMLPGSTQAQVSSGIPGKSDVYVVEIEGVVEVARSGSGTWDRAYTNQVLAADDKIRTMERSRAVVHLPNFSPVRLGPLSLLEMPSNSKPAYGFLRGFLYFFHRDKPGTLPIRTPTVATLIRGTEFNLRVDGDGATTLSLFDGEVEMTNAFGALLLRSGEEGSVRPAEAPRKVAGMIAPHAVQWALYYPAVVDPDELAALAGLEVAGPVLARYRQGDVLGALAMLPVQPAPSTASERLLHASLSVAVGEVGLAEALASSTPDTALEPSAARLAKALGVMMAAVQGKPGPAPSIDTASGGASEWLAESYRLQARADLSGALTAAGRAVRANPGFGFAWVRVAELEFSFGRVGRARSALERGLRLCPRHAQAVALQGFLLAAENRTREASASFSQAIALDGALANAWLGRGLCHIRHGDVESGVRDLQTAATLEPTRAVLRSYLGKALDALGDDVHADRELDLARRMDPNDPTAWLYSALLRQQRNEINTAIRDLNHAGIVAGERGVYRSQLLLDQDRAVQGANLAGIYLDAGFIEPALWSAARAATADPGNPAAHLFLAESYQALRDPRQINLRYETPWFNEYLLANLLAPVGSGTLSPLVTQQEYSKLFERERHGAVSATEYFSGGDWTQVGALHGVLPHLAYAAEVVYRSENGEWRNQDLEQVTVSVKLKQELTPQDSVYFQATYYEAEFGDVAQHYAPSTLNETLRVEERQEPFVLAGYHHQWSPGSHTLVLASRMRDTLEVTNAFSQALFFDRSSAPGGEISEVAPLVLDQMYESDLTLYTIEAQQILPIRSHTGIFGARYQYGEFDTENVQGNSRFPFPSDVALSARQSVESDLHRATAYVYDHWRVLPSVLLHAGLSYDWTRYPINHRFGPVSGDESERDQVSPKGGVIWTPVVGTAVRGAYAQSLGGVSLDQSIQLEPSHIAGFNQSFRSLAPESAAGSIPVPRFETAGVSLEQQWGANTYAGVSGQWLESDGVRAFGAFAASPPPGGFATESTREAVDYRERSVLVSLHRLLGDQWAVRGTYLVSQAELSTTWVDIPQSATLDAGLSRSREVESVLHRTGLSAFYYHPAGWFGQCDALWTLQTNDGYSPDRSDENFWQFNVQVGYRLPRRRAELRVGLLNVTGQDYRLSPLNHMTAPPRERTLAVALRLSF